MRIIKALEHENKDFNQDFVYFMNDHKNIKAIFDKHNIIWKHYVNNYYVFDENKFKFEDFKKDIKSTFGSKFDYELSEIDKRLKQPLEINFKDLGNFTKDYGYNSKQIFILIGDAIDLNINENISIFNLVFNNNPFNTLKVYTNNNQFMPNKYDLSIMNEQKEVKVTGILDVHEMQFQITPIEKIEILGEAKRLKQLREWEGATLELKKQETYYYLPQRIGLIAKKYSKGYTDFKKILGNNYYNQYVGERLKNVSLTSANIIKSINEFNNEKSCDCIFIVSGGGDPYWLLNFSNIDLLKVISESKIPILTGVAHSDDKLLCDNVSSISVETPTKAAEHIIMLIKAKNKKIRESIYYQNKNDLKLKIENLKKRIDELENDLQKKQKIIDDIKNLLQGK